MIASRGTCESLSDRAQQLNQSTNPLATLKAMVQVFFFSNLHNLLVGNKHFNCYPLYVGITVVGDKKSPQCLKTTNVIHV